MCPYSWFWEMLKAKIKQNKATTTNNVYSYLYIYLFLYKYSNEHCFIFNRCFHSSCFGWTWFLRKALRIRQKALFIPFVISAKCQKKPIHISELLLFSIWDLYSARIIWFHHEHHALCIFFVVLESTKSERERVSFLFPLIFILVPLTWWQISGDCISLPLSQSRFWLKWKWRNLYH